MLYPDFNELVTLKSKAARLTLYSHHTVISSLSGDEKSPFRGQGLTFEEVRGYTPGDDVRLIDWRVTARTNKPHIKIFKEERQRCVILCIDVNNTMRFGTRTTFKSIQAARCAALLAWHANMYQDRVGACLFGDVTEGLQYFTAKRSRQALWRLFKCLCQAEVNNPAVALDKPLQHIKKTAPKGSLIFLISDFMTLPESLERSLRDVKKRCEIVLISVNDPADRSIPAIATLLINDGKHSTTINTDNPRGRHNYATQWKNNRMQLTALAKRVHIPIIPLTTTGDVQRDLLHGLAKIHKARGQR